MSRTPQKAFRFSQETVSWIKELQKMISEELGGAYISERIAVEAAIRNEYHRRKEDAAEYEE